MVHYNDCRIWPWKFSLFVNATKACVFVCERNQQKVSILKPLVEIIARSTFIFTHVAERHQQNMQIIHELH
jgi:hypothetical protein